MKRFVLFCVLLAAVCIPMTALGETWAEFVARAEHAMKDARGDVVVRISEDVGTAYNVPLTVPADVLLVIEGEGGSFSDMLMTGGDVTLRGKGMSARQIRLEANRHSKNAHQAKLTIEKGVTIESLVSAGIFPMAAALEIYNYGQIKPRVNEKPLHLFVEPQRGDVSLTFHNYGEIESSGVDCGLEISGYSEGRNCAITVHNEGVIKTEGLFDIYGVTYRNGAIRIDFTNSGSISTRGDIWIGPFASINNNGFDVSVENLRGGVIENTSTAGSAVSIWYANPIRSGAARFMNAGTVRAPGSPVQILEDTANRGTFDFSNTGELVSGNPNAPTVEITIWQSVERMRDIITEEKFEGQASRWLERSGFHALPAGTRIRALLQAYNWKDWDVFTISDKIVESRGHEALVAE